MNPTRRALLGASVAAASLSYAGLVHAQSAKGILVVAKQIADLTSADPGESFEWTGAEICGNVYQKLVTTPNDDPARLTGDLAESWEASPDSRTFTFRLKEGPRFASGNPVTAEDAAWSLQRAVLLNKSPAFIINQFGFTKDNVAERIRATDARTLVLTTAEPTAPTFLLYCLSAVVGSVIDKRTAMAHAQGDDLGNAWLKQNTAGSGPYMLRAWRANESIALDANPHAQTAPATPRVVIRHVSDPSAQLLGLQRGDFDIARDLSADQLRQIADKEGFRVHPQRRASVMYLSLNQKVEPFTRPEVRQAIKMAIDYEGIQRNVVPTTYAVNQTFLPQGLPGALTDTPFRQSVDEARALLARAGLPDGFEASFDHTASAPFMDIAQAVQANLALIGIRLRMNPGDSRQVVSRTRARQHEVALLQWGSDYFDPNSNAEAFSINTDNSDDARNRTLAWRANWLIPELSARTLAARKETDAAKRTQMYVDLQRDLQRDSPFVMLFQLIENSALRSTIGGLDTGPMSDRYRYHGITKG
ncbi:MAG TPA: ABC transporter substrate-binding protein [Roseomonas sp.]|nr:ABC transporter substrate-binding protein [Roseomonas sp.]